MSLKKLSPNKKWLFMKNLIPLYLVLVCTMPLCWGIRHDPDEWRRWVLEKSAQKNLQSYQEMRSKIKTIISNHYTGMEDLTEKEKNYLLKEFLLRDGDTQNLSFTEQVFFEKFITWASLKKISTNLVSESKNIPSISSNSVLIDEIMAKLLPTQTTKITTPPSVPQNASEPFSRNFSETLSTILPTEEIPFLFDDDEGSGYFFPERLS
jgi:hypothetical protein